LLVLGKTISCLGWEFDYWELLLLCFVLSLSLFDFATLAAEEDVLVEF
jgi:hypothetical protein